MRATRRSAEGRSGRSGDGCAREKEKNGETAGRRDGEGMRRWIARPVIGLEQDERVVHLALDAPGAELREALDVGEARNQPGGEVHEALVGPQQRSCPRKQPEDDLGQLHAREYPTGFSLPRTKCGSGFRCFQLNALVRR